MLRAASEIRARCEFVLTGVLDDGSFESVAADGRSAEQLRMCVDLLMQMESFGKVIKAGGITYPRHVTYRS